MIKDIAGSPAIRRIFSACLVLAALLFYWPLFAAGQQLLKLDNQKDKEPATSSLIGLLETDEAIDKEVARIKAQVDKLLAEGTGAGKEVAARAIHDLSRRQARRSNRRPAATS